jgi:UDP-GlcNAc:undecaprenyl-phosphate GlcNAc-1-phosphate transferase
MINLLSFALSFTLTLALVPFFVRLAKKLGFIDKPSVARKIHKNPTPVIGGLLIGTSVVIVFTVISILTKSLDSNIILIMSIFLLYLILGALDDRFDVKAKQKFLIQIICAVILVKKGIYLKSLSIIFGIEFPVWFLQSFTVLVIVGVVNAYNLIDGVDGLLGGMLIFGFSWLLTLSILFSMNQLTWILLSLMASIIVFLRFNFSRKSKIFMGDGGSLSLGFVMIMFSIMLFEKSNLHFQSMNWMSIGIIASLIVPVVDTVIVFSRRINKYHSPFEADRSHLHHLILRLDFSNRFVAIPIFIFSLVLSAIALILSLNGNQIMSFLFMPFGILIFYVFLYKWQLYHSSKKIIRDIEKLPS